MHSILVPVDGSDHALKAITIACDLAEKYGGRVALLHVLAGDMSGDNQPEVTGQKILDQAASRVSRRGIDVDVLDLGMGDPAECILIAHKSAGASTIVMGCRGTRRDGESAFGSVSSTVFERAECTCISVK